MKTSLCSFTVPEVTVQLEPIGSPVFVLDSMALLFKELKEANSKAHPGTSASSAYKDNYVVMIS